MGEGPGKDRSASFSNTAYLSCLEANIWYSGSMSACCVRRHAAFAASGPTMDFLGQPHSESTWRIKDVFSLSMCRTASLRSLEVGVDVNAALAAWSLALRCNSSFASTEPQSWAKAPVGAESRTERSRIFFIYPLTNERDFPVPAMPGGSMGSVSLISRLLVRLRFPRPFSASCCPILAPILALNRSLPNTTPWEPLNKASFRLLSTAELVKPESCSWASC